MQFGAAGSGVDHVMAIQFDVKIFDFLQIFRVMSGNGQVVDQIQRADQQSKRLQLGHRLVVSSHLSQSNAWSGRTIAR